MAFRASNMLPAQGLHHAKSTALQITNYLESRRAQFQGDTNSDVVLATFHDMRRFRDELVRVRDIPGIGEFAAQQENDETYDVAAEFGGLISALEAAMTEIRTTFPVDGDGHLLEKKWAADGTYEFRAFTGVQLSNLRARLDAVIAAVS